jgi:hypothetical protein
MECISICTRQASLFGKATLNQELGMLVCTHRHWIDHWIALESMVLALLISSTLLPGLFRACEFEREYVQHTVQTRLYSLTASYICRAEDLLFNVPLVCALVELANLRRRFIYISKSV